MVILVRVFVTDAAYKHTLAVVRSLGRQGVEVGAGSTSRHSVSFYSNFVRSKYIYPDPKATPERFVNSVNSILLQEGYDVFLPIGYNATVAASKFREHFDGQTAVPVVNYRTLSIAADKAKTINFAEEIGIPMPKTVVCKNIKDVKATEELKFPVVIKGTLEGGSTTYANEPAELESKCNFLFAKSQKEALIQEYIPGDGYGFFALLNKGKPRAIFMHKRTREYPVRGGPSTAAESIYEPRLKELGLKILQSLKWHGVAMVEFKKDLRDGEYKLMEINPKFWGSLDLAIASGVDFPYLACKMAVDGDVKQVFRYNVGVKFLWPFPYDLVRSLTAPLSIPAFVKDLSDSRVRKNISWNDLNPNLIQILKSFVMIKQLATSRKSGEFRAEFR